MCLTCRSLAELFNFIGLVEIQQYISSILKQSVTEYINKFKHITNKIFDFLLCFKGIRCIKLEIDFNIGGGRLGHLDLVTHPDMNPVQPSLTLVNRRVKRSSHQLQNVNNLPKDYIRVCLTCRSLAELFHLIGLVELREYI